MKKTANQASNPKIAARQAYKGPAKSKQRADDLAQNAWPAEGPHARPDLVNDAATPGTGLFSDNQTRKIKVDPGAG
jgi:hypothetical protein